MAHHGGAAQAGGATYVETLYAPPALYAAAWGFGVLLAISFAAVLGPVGALPGIATGIVLTVLLARTGTQIRVETGDDEATLVAGPARIPVAMLGPARALDAEQARQVRGPQSDPAAYHLIRGWVPAGVLARVVDPGDPTPYWFVASRRPEQLAAAIEAARRPGAPAGPDQGPLA